MFGRIGRLFVIKTRVEACLVIFALALGAAERGGVYLARFPGVGGRLLFMACLVTVLMAGAKIMDCLRFERGRGARR